jgi:hypothetical protein
LIWSFQAPLSRDPRWNWIALHAVWDSRLGRKLQPAWIFSWNHMRVNNQKLRGWTIGTIAGVLSSAALLPAAFGSSRRWLWLFVGNRVCSCSFATDDDSDAAAPQGTIMNVPPPFGARRGSPNAPFH